MKNGLYLPIILFLLFGSGCATTVDHTPKDFELATIMRDVADLAVAHRTS